MLVLISDLTWSNNITVISNIFTWNQLSKPTWKNFRETNNGNLFDGSLKKYNFTFFSITR